MTQEELKAQFLQYAENNLNNETVNELLKFWDAHHLEEITDDEKNELLKLCDKMEEFEDIEKVINERIVL